MSGGIYQRCVIKEANAHERVLRPEQRQPREKLLMPGNSWDDVIYPDDM
jgi:hypothetical protein